MQAIASTTMTRLSLLAGPSGPFLAECTLCAQEKCSIRELVECEEVQPGASNSFPRSWCSMLHKLLVSVRVVRFAMETTWTNETLWSQPRNLSNLDRAAAPSSDRPVALRACGGRHRH